MKLEVTIQSNLEDSIDIQIRFSSKLESTKEAFRKAKKWGRFSLVACVIGIILMILDDTLKFWENYLYIIGLAILFLNFLYSELTPFIWKKRIRKFITKEYIDTGETRIVFTENGIDTYSKGITVNYFWEELGELNIEKGLVEFYFTKKGMIILREKYFTNLNEMGQFLSQVRNLLPETKKSLLADDKIHFLSKGKL